MSDVPVLHEGAHELVVWKPPSLAAELPRDPQADSLVTRLADLGFPGLRLVHRLDAASSGLMLLARDQSAAAYYSAEIAARRWHKVYVAALETNVLTASGLLGDHKAYLVADGRVARVVRAGGKPSFLSIVHAAASPDGPGRSLVLIRLLTGRFHQIRVMLSSMGAPLAGDALYGARHPCEMYLEQVVLGAQCLGATTTSVWRAPDHMPRRAWPASLAAAIEAEAARIGTG